MIKKLKKQNTWGECLEKLNEVIDAVNKLETMAKNTNTVLKSLVEENNIHEEQIDELQMKLEPEKCETFVSIDEALKKAQKAEPADPYAEQRKWVGKVCWFWDNDNTNSSCGILTSIDTETFKEPQFVCNDEYDYEHCEPVKPDDDIIYKGGDND